MALTNWLKAALNLELKGGKNKGRKSLVTDQRDLAVKLKVAFESLEKELAEISQSIRDCDDDFEAMDMIRVRQEHVRSLLNRIRAGFKRTADLERELSEWRSLMSATGSGRSQADKCEILESELELRGVPHESLNPKSTPSVPPTFVTVEVSDEPIEEARDEFLASPVILGLDEASFDQESANHLDMQPEALLAGIKYVSEELAKGQEFNANDPENMATLHELREMHAALKAMDRKQGFCRDRIAATQGFSRLFRSID